MIFKKLLKKLKLGWRNMIFIEAWEIQKSNRALEVSILVLNIYPHILSSLYDYKYIKSILPGDNITIWIPQLINSQFFNREFIFKGIDFHARELQDPIYSHNPIMCFQASFCMQKTVCSSTAVFCFICGSFL